MGNPVLRLESLTTYPVKSCAAVHHEAVDVDRFGLAWDRRWMVVDGAGQFVTQRSHPLMARVCVALDGAALRLSAPGLDPIAVSLEAPARRTLPATVWDHTGPAWDEGDAAAAWLSSCLGTAVRLVRFPGDAVRRVNPEYSPEPAQTAFADGYPLLLASTASLDDLNLRLVSRGASPVTMDRFRPNLVVTGVGLAAYAEDGWKRIRIGAVEFDVAKPCVRCVMTTTDQASGTIPEPGEPLGTLATYRRWGGGVIFAQNLVHRGTGRIAVGDAVEVVR